MRKILMTSVSLLVLVGLAACGDNNKEEAKKDGASVVEKMTEKAGEAVDATKDAAAGAVKAVKVAPQAQ